MIKNTFTLFLSVILFLSLNQSWSQTGDNQSYNYQISMDPDFVFREFSNLRFKKICSDTVLVTRIGKRSKSYDLDLKDLKLFMKNNYFKGKGNFEISSIMGNGSVIVISQYPINGKVPERFFTLYISPSINKIVVIEIEENK